MRVLLLSSHHPPFGGQAALAADALARGLAGKGAMVDLVTMGERKERVSQLHWDGVVSEEGALTVHQVKATRSGRQGELVDTFDYLLAATPVARSLLRAERYDVVQVFLPLSTGIILPFLNLQGAPLVVSLYPSDVPGYDWRRRVNRRLRRPLSRWLWRRADRIVVASEALGRLALRTLPTLRYSVIHHGVDLVRFRPRAANQIRRNPRIRCLAVSRLLRGRGLVDLIHAISSMDPCRFELEILGSGAAEHPLRSIVSNLGIAERVTFTGPLDSNQLAHHYRNADLFAVGSWEDGFDNGLAEALASGLPIIGPDTRGIPGLVEQGRNGLLVPPRDPTALAAAIERLGNDRILRARIGNRNRADAVTGLAWDRVTARYLSIYQGVRRAAPAQSLLAELPTSTW